MTNYVCMYVYQQQWWVSCCYFKKASNPCNTIITSILLYTHNIEWYYETAERTDFILPFIFYIWHLYHKPWPWYLRLYVLRTFWPTSAIVVVYSNLKDIFRRKNGIKSWTVSCEYFLQLSTWINSTTVHRWTQFLPRKLHQGPVFIVGMVSSTEVVVHSNTNFVNVVQN